MRGKAHSHKVANDQAVEGEQPTDAKDAVIKYYKERKQEKKEEKSAKKKVGQDGEEGKQEGAGEAN